MNNSQLLIFQSFIGNIKTDVRLEEENVWLSQQLMVELFQTTAPSIIIHLKSICEEGALEKKQLLRIACKFKWQESIKYESRYNQKKRDKLQQPC